MTRTELELKKVAELKEMSRERNLTLESKGHKFTKSELIDRLMWYEDEQADINKKIEESANTEKIVTNEESEEWDAPVLKENKEEPKKVFVVEHNENREIKPVVNYDNVTLSDIIEKYSVKKEDYIYDKVLAVGSYVVYMRYIEAKNGKLFKKLGTAKVVGINRSKKLVRIETPVKEVKELQFEDLLYITNKDGWHYPTDIYVVLKRQREEYLARKERMVRYE